MATYVHFIMDPTQALYVLQSGSADSKSDAYAVHVSLGTWQEDLWQFHILARNCYKAMGVPTI